MTKKLCQHRECPYYPRVEVPYSGSREAELIIVGESPGSTEILKGKPFVGLSGHVLDALLTSIGYSRELVYIANSCRCLINKEDDPTKMQNAALKQCRGKLVKVIKKIAPKVVVAMGNVALLQLLGKKKITENRGRFFYSEELGCHVFVTVHPAFVLRSASKEFWLKAHDQRSMVENLLFEDFKQVRKFLDTQSTDRIVTTNYKEGTEADLQQLAKHKVLAFDFETTGLDLFDQEIRVLCVSFCGEPGQPRVFFPDDEGRFHPKVVELLTSKAITKVVANRPFDERVCVQKLGFTVQGLVHDVRTMGHLVDENYRSYSLEALADIYTPLKGIKDLAEGQRGSLERIDRDKLIAYSAVDADATLRVYRALSARLKADPSLLRYYLRFTLQVQNMLADTFYNGTPVDTKQLSADEKALVKMRDELEDQALMMIPRVIREDPKHIKKQKLSRAALVADYLFFHKAGLKLKPKAKYLTPKTKKPQISEAHLVQFPDVPFITAYLRMCKVSKIVSTYLSRYWEFVKADGKVYPSINMANTRTGRTTVSEPEIQTVPQRSDLAKYAKRCFVAPEGWLMGARDLGQSEIRIIGWVAQDPTILGALAKGIDIHVQTAAMVNGVPIEQVSKEMRRKAKAVTFGFAYGMSPGKFQRYAKDNYGIDFELEQCNSYRDRYFVYPTGYYKLPEYYRRQEHHAATYGFVRSPLGRVRHLPQAAQTQDKKLQAEAFRQAINTPIQSFSSDLTLIGLVCFWREVNRLGLRDVIKPTWMIHDANMFLARSDVFPRAMALLKRCMEQDAKEYVQKYFELEIGYPVTSDGKAGPTWADLKEWDDDKHELKKKDAA